MSSGENAPLAVVPTYLRSPDDFEVLLRCLVSLQATAPDCEVLVVDDGSPASDIVEQLGIATEALGIGFSPQAENHGFATAVNIGMRAARDAGRDAVLVNADVEFPDPGWLDRMRARTGTDGRPAAVVGARLLYPNGLIQHAGVFFSLLRRGFFHRFQYGPAELPEALVPCRCPVTAALQLIRHETLERIGLYDESYGLAHEDVDYCLRVFEAGEECIYEPSVRAVHFESLFRGRQTDLIRQRHEQASRRLLERWGHADFSRWTPAAL